MRSFSSDALWATSRARVVRPLLLVFISPLFSKWCLLHSGNYTNGKAPIRLLLSNKSYWYLALLSAASGCLSSEQHEAAEVGAPDAQQALGFLQAQRFGPAGVLDELHDFTRLIQALLVDGIAFCRVFFQTLGSSNPECGGLLAIYGITYFCRNSELLRRLKRPHATATVG